MWTVPLFISFIIILSNSVVLSFIHLRVFMLWWWFGVDPYIFLTLEGSWDAGSQLSSLVCVSLPTPTVSAEQKVEDCTTTLKSIAVSIITSNVLLFPSTTALIRLYSADLPVQSAARENQNETPSTVCVCGGGHVLITVYTVINKYLSTPITYTYPGESAPTGSYRINKASDDFIWTRPIRRPWPFLPPQRSPLPRPPAVSPARQDEAWSPRVIKLWLR